MKKESHQYSFWTYSIKYIRYELFCLNRQNILYKILFLISRR